MGVSIKNKAESSRKKKTKNKVIAKQVYREIITPSQKKVSITLPETLVGKTVEVFAFEVHQTDKLETLKSKPFSKKNFWETFGSGKSSLLSAENIRESAWRKSKW